MLTILETGRVFSRNISDDHKRNFKLTHKRNGFYHTRLVLIVLHRFVLDCHDNQTETLSVDTSTEERLNQLGNIVPVDKWLRMAATLDK